MTVLFRVRATICISTTTLITCKLNRWTRRSLHKHCDSAVFSYVAKALHEVEIQYVVVVSVTLSQGVRANKSQSFVVIVICPIDLC